MSFEFWKMISRKMLERAMLVCHSIENTSQSRNLKRFSVLNSRQAGENCTILEKLGLFVYVFLKTSYCSSAFFVNFLIFC